MIPEARPHLAILDRLVILEEVAIHE